MTKAPSTDHDLLITLNVKVDNLSVAMKEVGDGTGKGLADHEARIRKIESDHEAVNPLQSFKDLQEVKGQLRDNKITANAYRVVAGFVGGGIFFILTQLPVILRGFGLIR
jgi:hypothetical protein